MICSAKKSPSEQAAATVKERGATYGHPLEDFTRTAALWTAILGDRLNTPLNALDVAQMMRMVKESRLVKTPDHYDSLMDICGYADCQHACVSAMQDKFTLATAAGTFKAKLSDAKKVYEELAPIKFPKAELVVDPGQLKAGVSVWLIGDEREWVVDKFLGGVPPLWAVRCAAKTHDSYQPAKLVGIEDIRGLYKKVDIKA